MRSGSSTPRGAVSERLPESVAAAVLEFWDAHWRSTRTVQANHCLGPWPAVTEAAGEPTGSKKTRAPCTSSTSITEPRSTIAQTAPNAESVSRAAVLRMPMLARRLFIMDGSGSACVRRQQALDYWKDQGLMLVTVYSSAFTSSGGRRHGPAKWSGWVSGSEGAGNCCGAAGDAEPLVDVLQVLAYGVLR